MGNCLRNNQISALEEKYEPPVEPSEAQIGAVEQKKTTLLASKLEPARREERMKKMVRFKSERDERGGRGSCGNGRSRPTRIKVVVTQKELKRILSNNNDVQETSLEQLLVALKVRGTRISGVGECDWGMNPWRPALESIPEDHSMK